MQYENKILMSAILIIAIGLISFNFIGPNISGRVSKECPTLDISATRNGAFVTATVIVPENKPGITGRPIDYSKGMNLYRPDSNDNPVKVADVSINRGYYNTPGGGEIRVTERDLYNRYAFVGFYNECTKRWKVAKIS